MVKWVLVIELLKLMKITSDHAAREEEGALDGGKICVFGATCRETGKIALKATRRRRAIDCLDFIRTHVNEGTHLLEDRR